MIKFLKNLFKSKWGDSEFVTVFTMKYGNESSNASLYKQKHIDGHYRYYSQSQWGTDFIDGNAYEKYGKFVFLEKSES